MEEEVDLTSHVTVLSSCIAVIKKMRQKGQVTAEEEKRARTYLKLHERPWPNQPEIQDGAILYLDNLTITHLRHLALLEKVHVAGLTVIASPQAVADADGLILYESLSEQVSNAIERIRSALSSQIESGRVKVGRLHNVRENKNNVIPGHPTVNLIDLARCCEGVIVDDRLINQHALMDDGTNRTRIYSTLDVIDTLESMDIISVGRRLECRTLLRQAGYLLLPVEVQELEHCLKAAEIYDAEVIETAELKAIRESILRIRMGEWLQLPDEISWLDDTLKALIRVLRSLWTDDAIIADTTSRSNWVANLVDARGWAHRLERQNANNFIRIGRGAHILLLLTPPYEAKQEVIDAYWVWVEETILSPIEEQFPELYEWLVEWNRRQVAEVADGALSQWSES